MKYSAKEITRTYEGRETFMVEPKEVSIREFEFESSSPEWELINEAEILSSAGRHEVCGETHITSIVEVRAVP